MKYLLALQSCGLAFSSGWQRMEQLIDISSHPKAYKAEL
jgi:hypothetical protein